MKIPSGLFVVDRRAEGLRICERCGKMLGRMGFEEYKRRFSIEAELCPMCGETAIIPWEERPKAWLDEDRRRAMLTAHGAQLPPWDKNPFKDFVRGKYYIYFIQGENGGPIKIGRAVDVEGRLKQLQTSFPERLRIVGTITSLTGKTEGGVHGDLWEYHIRGEWFRPHPEVIAYILKYRSRTRYRNHGEKFCDPIPEVAGTGMVTNVLADS